MMIMQKLLSTDLGKYAALFSAGYNFLVIVSQSLRNKKNAQQENDSDEAIPADSKNEL
jgi:hypothetical protein